MVLFVERATVQLFDCLMDETRVSVEQYRQLVHVWPKSDRMVARRIKATLETAVEQGCDGFR